MGLAHSPRIATDGLVLCLDAANQKSYLGSGTVWTDLSGNGNNGTLVNGVGYSTDNKGSLVFDGTDDYVDLIANANTRFQNNQQTWSGWTYITSTGPNVYSEIWTNGGNAGVTLQWRPYEITLFMFNSGYFGYTVPVSNQLNTWTHTSIIIDNVSRIMSVYKNGVFVGNSPQWNPYTFPNGYVRFGGNFATGNTGDLLRGRVSNIQIYNRALSSEEIQQNFNALRGRYGI